MSQKYKSNGNGFVNLSKSGQKYPQARTSKRAFNSNQSQQNSNININNPEINFGHNQIDPPKININFEEDIASHLINLNPEGNPNLEKKNKKLNTMMIFPMINITFQIIIIYTILILLLMK